MRDKDRMKCYRAEDMAFKGTALGESPGAERLTEVARVCLDWLGFTDVSLVVRKARYSVAENAVNLIRFDTKASLSTVAHEVAHIVDWRAQTYDVGHGPTWRGWFYGIVYSMHGEEYAEALKDAFASFGLGIVIPKMPVLATPMFPERPTVGGWTNHLTSNVSSSRMMA